MDTDYAWAAGFWDGEGNVSLSYRGAHKIPRIVIQVAQVDRRVLDKFQSIMGFGNVLGPYTPRSKNSSPYYVWRVEGVPYLPDFSNKLWPYLGEAKKVQIERAIEARAIWEATGVCAKGHRLSQSDKGHWRCQTCQSNQGKLNAAARWAGKER